MVNLYSVCKTNILVILQHVYVNAVISTNLPTVPFFCRGCRLTGLYCASVSQQLSYGFQTTRWNTDSDTKIHLVQSFCVHRLLRHTFLLVHSIKSNAHLADIGHVQELYPLNTSSSGSRSRKQRLTAVGTRCADHVTPLYSQKLALTSPTGGGRSIGIVRVRTKATELVSYRDQIKMTPLGASVNVTYQQNGKYVSSWKGTSFEWSRLKWITPESEEYLLQSR